MAGRYIAGTGQLLIALGGAAFILVWFANVIKVVYTIMQSTGEPDPKHWMGLLGFGLLFLAWCWAWVSSIGILRELKRGQERRWESGAKPTTSSAVPPRMQNK